MSGKTPSLSKQVRFSLITLLGVVTSFGVYVYNQEIFSWNHMVPQNQTILNMSESYSRSEVRGLVPMDLQLNTSTNSQITKPKQVLSQYWQQTGTKGDLNVFSAYLLEEEKIVQIIGISRRTTNITCACIFHCHSTTEQDTVIGKLEIIPEHRRKTFGAVFMRCPLKNVSKPSTVGIVGDNITTTLRVNHASPRRFNFTVCIASLHGPYGNPFRIVEMVETDMIFGADYFLVYNYSTTPEVDRVLRYYVKRGKMEIIQWNLPKADVWYWGQMASLQDCTYASRQITKYLVLKDIDEFIVPHKHKNWHELMKQLDNSTFASYLFRNTFFRLDWKSDVNGFKGGTAAALFKLTNLLYTWREKYFFPAKLRSKAIIHPERVVTGGIHFPWTVEKGYKIYDVDTKTAFLHHYRVFRGNKPRIKEDAMRKFSDELIQNVNKTLRELGCKNIAGKLRLSV